MSVPLRKIDSACAGSALSFSGILYTARDRAHRRLVEAIKSGARLPLDLRGQMLYYCGPTRTPPGKAVGSCGPTTSSRMDVFTPFLLKATGLKGMVGKGGRSKEVIGAIRKYRAAYFITYAGCGALLSKCVLRARLVAYPDLGPEAIYEFTVKDFPLIVAVDSKGRSIYAEK